VSDLAERPVHGDQPQVGADVVRGGDGVDDDVEPVSRPGHLSGVRRHDEVVGAQPAGVVGLARRPADDRGRRAERDRELDREVSQAAQPGHGDAGGGPDPEGA
jgi:hypothetical protein